MNTRWLTLVCCVCVVSALLLSSGVSAKSKRKSSSSGSSGSSGSSSKVAVPVSTAVAGLDKLAERAYASSDGTVRLSAREYSELVQVGPRWYSVLLLMTVSQPGRGCRPCEMLWGPYTDIASAYRRNHLTEVLDGVRAAASNETTAAETVGGMRTEDLPLFFVVVDYDRGGGGNVFRVLDVQQTPHLSFVGPSTRLAVSKKKLDIDNDRRWRSPWGPDGVFDLARKGFGVDVINQFVTTSSGLEIDLSRPLPWLAISLVLIPSVAGFWYAQDVIRKVVAIRKLFFGAFLACTVYCFSGFVFCSIRDTPFSQQVSAGSPEQSFVYPSQRMQFGAEAYIVGIIYTIAVLSGVMLLKGLPPALTKPSPSSMVTVTAVLVAFALYLALAMASNLFTRKLPSYPSPLLSFGSLFPFSWGYFTKFG